MKKIFALCVSSIFVLSLGIAYGQEDDVMPWQRAEPQNATSAKKEVKAKKKDGKIEKAKNRKADKQAARKTAHKKMKTSSHMKTGMVKKTSLNKTETREPEQKKKFIFW